MNQVELEIKTLTPDLQSNWDDFVDTHPLATPYHKTGWMQAVNKAYGFSSIGLVAVEGSTIVGVLPLVVMKTPLGKRSVCSLPYCDAGGALVSAENAEALLHAHVAELAAKKQWHKAELRYAASETAEDVEQFAKVRMLLDLPETSEQLMSSFKSKLRSQIRKAEKNGLTATLGTDEAHLNGFYQVYARNMRDLGSPAHSKAWFQSIVGAYGSGVMIACVYHENQVIGAGLVIRTNDKVSIPWASTNADFNRLAPNMLLYWTLLQYANDSGAKIFDFGRSTPGEGTYKFKKQWGAEPAPLNWQEFDGQQFSSVGMSKSAPSSTRKQLESIWRKMPVGLATFVGSNVRKYISL